MKQHLDALKYVLENGTKVEGDRSGTGTLSVIGMQERYDLSTGKLPFCTTRKLNFDKTLSELIWFLRGDANVAFLEENNVPFWKKWTSPTTNTIGPMYPVLWRKKPEVSRLVRSVSGTKYRTEHDNIIYIDQLKSVVESLQSNPLSRRHYISNIQLGLRPDETIDPIENVDNGKMALDTCHQVFYLNARELTKEELEKVKIYRKKQSDYFKVLDSRELPKYKLSGMLQMRSNDMMVGKPHNIAQYSLMVFILAHVLNMHPGEYIHSVNDSHIYLSHLNEVKEQISRTPLDLPDIYISPNLTKEVLLNTPKEMTNDLFHLNNYQSLGVIKLALEG